MFSVSLLAEDTKPLIIYPRHPYAGDLYLLNLLKRQSPISFYWFSFNKYNWWQRKKGFTSHKVAPIQELT